MITCTFRGIDVVDGTGAPRYRADVTVADGHVARIDTVPGRHVPGARVIDGGGLVLAPGFIDMHAHSDLALVADPVHLAKVSQGCTTEVVGQDGLSYAPCDDATLAALREQLAAWNGSGDITWRTVGEYLDRIDAGCAVNAAYLVPHGTVRLNVLGYDDRPPTTDELGRMRRLVAEGLDSGAVGLSAGLSYVPGMYAATDELVELCTVVGRAGGYFAPHQRSYGAGALEGYAEMISIGRQADCPVHLTHATMNFSVNAHRAGELLDLIDAASHVDVTLDTYPYLPGATSLSALLPSWSLEGSLDACARRLHDPIDRAKIRHELDLTGSDGAHGVAVQWELIEISGVAREHNRHLVGRTIADAAGDIPPSTFYLDLLLDENFATSCLMHVGNEENLRAIMVHRHHMGGSDGLLHGDRPHPRAWGTFPRYLARYVRDLELLSLEECVAHLTGRPAARLGLRDRGILAEGAVADLVAFDPDTVADTATFAEPRRQPAGIPYVLVNGAFAMDSGRRTDALAGRSIRRSSARRGLCPGQLLGALGGPGVGAVVDVLELGQVRHHQRQRHLGVQELQAVLGSEEAEEAAQQRFLVVVALSGRARGVGAAAGGDHHDLLAGQRAVAVGAGAEARHADVVQVGLQRGGDREVVHRGAQHEDVGVQHLVPDGLGDRVRLGLSRVVLGRVGLVGVVGERVHVGSRVDVEVAVGVRAVRVGGLPGVGEGRGDLAGVGVAAVEAGVEVQQGGHDFLPLGPVRTLR
ncbi:MAG TPA: D-aminoacylase [Stackebrandtia sp.]|nr:D-aminoacylase [Stackebrandtia sp.]HZE37347.1 D-aminoacylase [Stackebrandtia sp.]